MSAAPTPIPVLTLQARVVTPRGASGVTVRVGTVSSMLTPAQVSDVVRMH
jgi:hypothetical protein